MSLKRRHQIFAAAETQAGVAASGVRVVANGDFLVIDPVMTFEPEIYERDNINRESLSPLQPLTGIVTGTCSFSLELSGRAAAGGAPSWSLLLQACGFDEQVSDRISIGAISTNECFFHGEVITGGGSGALGTVIHQTFNGTTTLLFEPTSGTFTSGETITGSTSGAVATSTSTPTNDGYAWSPISTELLQFETDAPSGGDNSVAEGEVIIGGTSNAVAVMHATHSGSGTATVRVLDGIFVLNETCSSSADGDTFDLDSAPGFVMSQIPTLTLSIIEDGRYKELNGCRGTVTFSGNIGEPIMMNFEFKGLLAATAAGDAGAIPGVTYSSLIPNALLGVTYRVGDDSDDTVGVEVSPRLQSFGITHGNTMGIPRDAGQATGVYDAAHQTARSTEGNMVVAVAPETTFDWSAKLESGAAVRAYLSLGGVTDLFAFSIPGMVLTGESGGDTEGIATVDYAMRLGSRHDDGTDASNTEIVLSYTNV